MVDVTDRKALEAELRKRPREQVVAFASRCALRALPMFDVRLARSAHDTAQFVTLCRATLSGAVAATGPTAPDRVARAAAYAADAAYASAADAAYAASARSASAASAADAAYASAADASASASAAYAAAATSDLDSLEALSPVKSLFGEPLWPRGAPGSVAERWSSLRNRLAGDGAFAFWLRWYEAMRDGRAVDWEMLEEVVLIDNAVWEEGPDRIAEEIAKIEAKYIVASAPLDERVESDPATGLLRVVPAEISDRPLLSALLMQVEDALELALAQRANGLSETIYPTPLLRATLTKHANDPQRVEMNFVTAAKSLRRQIDETQDLPRSEENLALRDAVEEAARGVRASHPAVARVRELLARQALAELSAEDRARLEDAEPVLTAISADVMSEDFAADIRHLIAERGPPATSDAPPLPGLDEAARVFSRAGRSYDLLSKSREALERLENSTGFRAAKILATLGGLLALGLRVFGVL